MPSYNQAALWGYGKRRKRRSKKRGGFFLKSNDPVTKIANIPAKIAFKLLPGITDYVKRITKK